MTPDALEARCFTCGAQPAFTCRTTSGRSRKPHPSRGRPQKRGGLSPIPLSVRRQVERRSGGMCEMASPACLEGPHPACEMHHVVRAERSHHNPADILHACSWSHRWVHANPADAKRLGLLRSPEARSA